MTRAGAGQLAWPLSCVPCGAPVSGPGAASRLPWPLEQAGALGHDQGPGLQPLFLADEFQRLCALGLPLLPPYPARFPSITGFGSSGGLGPGLGPAWHSPQGSNGRGVPSLGFGDTNIGEDLGRRIQDLGEGFQSSEGGLGLGVGRRVPPAVSGWRWIGDLGLKVQI